MITGGMAVFVWGRPRFTADIDIEIQLEAGDIDVLASELMKISEFGYVDKDIMKEAFKKQGEFNFIDGQSGIKVDFWVKDKKSLEAEGFNRRITKNIAGQKVYFISPEDLILRKLVWHKKSESSRHFEDAESVVKISKIDKKYLKQFATKLGISDELNKLLKK